jgi:hypothetical protein
MSNALHSIFEKIRTEKLILPDFQRDYKWNSQKQSNLLASILLNFPVGSSLILNGKSTDFAVRKIGENKQYQIDKLYECEYLLDGQQRTTTLFNAFNDTFNFEQFTTEIELIKFMKRKSNPLKVRWFLRFPAGSDVNCGMPDIFDAKKLEFSKETLDAYEPSEISDLFAGYTFHEKNDKGTTKWFSPFYALAQKLKGNENTAIKNEFVKTCVRNGVVPLYHLGSEIGIKLVKRIIKQIAKSNSSALIDHYRGNFEELKKVYDPDDAYLSEHSTLKEFEEDGEEDFEKVLEKIFSDKESEWSNSVMNYLQLDIIEKYELMSLVTNDIRRAIPIFCHLNEGGMPLDDFDLVAAKAAKKLPEDEKTYSLSQTVRQICAKPITLNATLAQQAKSDTNMLLLDDFDCIKDGLPTSYIKGTILAVCTMLSRIEKPYESDQNIQLTKTDTSSKTLLSLQTSQIRKNIPIATTAVLRAFAFLLIKCGIDNASKLQYKLMIQPIAFAFTNDTFWNSSNSIEKIEHWYWSSVFSGKYLYDQSTVVIEDINLVYKSLSGATQPLLLKRAGDIFTSDQYSSKDLLTYKLQEYPKEAIRKHILQYILSNKPFDLISDKVEQVSSYHIDTDHNVRILPVNSLHDHHIIPTDLYKSLGEKSSEIRKDPSKIVNSPLNRVLISAKSNWAISSLDPSRYFKELGDKENFEAILSSQLINKKFSNVDTGDLSKEVIQGALEERFDALKLQVKQKLLAIQ